MTEERITALLRAAEEHGDNSDGDHEVGDLQDMLQAALRLLTPAQERCWQAVAGVAEVLDGPEYADVPKGPPELPGTATTKGEEPAGFVVRCWDWDNRRWKECSPPAKRGFKTTVLRRYPKLLEVAEIDHGGRYSDDLPRAQAAADCSAKQADKDRSKRPDDLTAVLVRDFDPVGLKTGNENGGRRWHVAAVRDEATGAWALDEAAIRRVVGADEDKPKEGAGKP